VNNEQHTEGGGVDERNGCRMWGDCFSTTIMWLGGGWLMRDIGASFNK
jgi:hypothetical protein